MMRLKLCLSAAAWGFYLPFVLALTVVSYALAYVIALPCFIRHDCKRATLFAPFCATFCTAATKYWCKKTCKLQPHRQSHPHAPEDDNGMIIAEHLFNNLIRKLKK
jgi:hypothetical protein